MSYLLKVTKYLRFNKAFVSSSAAAMRVSQMSNVSVNSFELKSLRSDNMSDLLSRSFSDLGTLIPV